MEKKKFITYCTRFVCSKSVVEEYVTLTDKQDYDSTDTDAVYQLALSKKTAVDDFPGRKCSMRMYGIGGTTSKKYEDQLSDRSMKGN